MQFVIPILTLLALPLVSTEALAKKPANLEVMKACNKGWSAFHKENRAVKHKEYMSKCMAGKVDPVAPVDPVDPAPVSRTR